VFPRRLASRILASHLLLALVAVGFGALAVGEFTGIVAAVAVALLGLAIGLTIGLARSLTRPIGRLAGSVRRMADGDLAERAPVPEAEELADLAKSLNSMATELRERIGQVAGERDRARQILGALENGVLLLDAEGGLLDANPTARRWFALPEFTPGAPARRVLGAPEVARVAEEALSSRQAVDGQVTLVFPEARTLAVRATPLTELGEAAGVVVTLADVTSRRRVEVVRRDFVANASHELKTPVAAIRALAEGLEVAIDDDPDTARRFMQRIGSEADRLERLVKDLLDLSKVERGTLAVEPVDMAGLVKDVAGRYAEMAGARGVELHVNLSPDVELRGDRAQLELLVSNLIDNALRYTEPGGSVWLRLTELSGKVEVAVEDTGMGIPSSDLPRVFERFYRIDKARHRQTGGTGLGLAIVRHVAESHGGKVTVDSELGRGSTFVATLPVVPPA
jgi:two-component system phosphate regulon sensor histidine kinase PhoR